MRGFDCLSGRNGPLSQGFHRHPRAETTSELADMEPPTGIPCKKPAAKLPTPSPTKSRETSGGDVVVWVSDDGLAWNHIAYYPDGQQVSGAITTSGDEIVAVGLDADKTTDIIWYSTDGEDWGILTPPAFGNAGGIPMVAYTHNNQIIILGSGDPPTIRRP